jgi:histidinol-phosphate phosphatase family protein
VPQPKKPAVFLDRDGVIITERKYLIDPDGIELIPGAIEALVKLGAKYVEIVISNQSGVARGYFSNSDVIKFNLALDKMLVARGIIISSWYYCPHGPDDSCDCRKPRPGMIQRAVTEMPIDLEQSWMIGDKSSDIGCGKALGLRTILVRTGYGGREPGASELQPDFVAADLLEAAYIILDDRE